MKFIIAIIFLFLGNLAYAQENIPITIIDPIEFKNTKIQGAIPNSKIEHLYDLEIYMGGNSADGVKLTNSKNKSETKIVKTCREYIKYRNDDWWPYTTYESTMASFFTKTCGIIEIIGSSAPSKFSKFKDFPPKDIKDLSLYPATMLDVVTIKGGTLCEGAKTLPECANQRKGKLEIKDGKLFFKDSNDYEAIFTPSLKADLNNDGYEDMILDYSYYITGGTFREYGQICVEWQKSQTMVSVIECKEKGTNKW